jgi:2-succinyl-5-enolpyruvyl-6-hydroxy-3-cyclohexene-1-carboxylate synthase
LGKRAADMLPKSSRRQLDDTVDRLQKVRKDTEKRLQKARKDLDKQVASVRKDVDKRTRGVVGTIEREARKQIEALYKRLNLPVQSDINSLKRRLTGIERKLDQLLKEQQSKKAAA